LSDVKKKEITEGKIYSSVGKFADRAKQADEQSDRQTDGRYITDCFTLPANAVGRNVEVLNKKHLKNVVPIRHNEPPHANSPDVASCLRIDVHDNDDNNDNA